VALRHGVKSALDGKGSNLLLPLDESCMGTEAYLVFPLF